MTTQANALHAAGDPAAEAKPNPTIRELLDRAADELAEDRIEESFPDQPLLQAEILRTVGNTYRGIGEYERAIEFLRRARQLHKAELGSDHPSTIVNMTNLAGAYQKVGQLDLALPLHEETLEVVKAKLGPEHRYMIVATNNLATGYMKAGKLDLALPLHEETLELSKAKLGPEHPSTIMSMNNLAIAYEKAGQLDLVFPLHEEALELAKAKLGPDHPQTLMTMIKLARAYTNAGQLDLAPPLLEEALERCEDLDGPLSKAVATGLWELALRNEEQARYSEALPLFERVYQLRKQSDITAAKQKILSENRYGWTLYRVGRFAEAEPRLLDSYRDGMTKDGFPAEWLVTYQSRLTKLYAAWDKPDEVARWLAEAVRFAEERFEFTKAKLGLNHPETLARMNHLAKVYRTSDKLDQALPLWVTISSATPEDMQLTLKVASLQAWFSQDKDFAVTADRALQIAKDTSDPTTAGRVAKVCCLQPSDAKARFAAALKLARFAVERGKKSTSLPSFRMALGMAEYRNGNFAAAEQALVAAVKGNEQNPHLSGTSEFYRAMCLFRQGKQTEARQLAIATAKKMRPLPQDAKNPLADNAGYRDVIVWLAYKEVQALIKFPPPKQPAIARIPIHSR